MFGSRLYGQVAGVGGADQGVGVAGVTAVREAEGAGHARYTFLLRVSATARAGLEAEWGRCRWIWNESVTRSQKAHREGEACGAARLDRMLTQARAVTPWLGAGSSVVQQQTIGDFAASRTKRSRTSRTCCP